MASTKPGASWTLLGDQTNSWRSERRYEEGSIRGFVGAGIDVAVTVVTGLALLRGIVVNLAHLCAVFGPTASLVSASGAVHAVNSDRQSVPF